MPPPKHHGIDLTKGGRGCNDYLATNEGATAPHTTKGLIIMTTYSTRTLAAEVLGDEGKAATRTLRKFLRDDMGDGKAVVGKGGRYALDMNKRELTALKKRFAAWEKQQEAEKAARAEKVAAAKSEPEAVEDDTNDAPEGPSDEEIAAMLSEGDEGDIEEEEDDEDIEGESF